MVPSLGKQIATLRLFKDVQFVLLVGVVTVE